MAAVLQIEFQDEGKILCFRVRQQRSQFHALLAGLIAAVASAAFLITYVTTRWAVILSAILGASSYITTRSAKRITLRVSSLELTTIGFFEGGGLRYHRFVLPTDIRWLEYRQETGGGEAAYHPSGVYAVLRSGAQCILPYLDERLSMQVISKIETQFPDFAEHWRQESPFTGHFTTLGLSGL